MLRFIQVGPSVGDGEARRVARENGISGLMASLLLSRGLSERAQIQEFLYPSLKQLHDAFLLPDMREATRRIERAIRACEPVCIYGDYDADGVCATAILLSYLLGCGADATPFLPSRHQEGYGLNEEAVRRLAQRGIRLIITVDNGISAAKEAALCRALGIDLIVTDHHQCPADLPVCTAIVNPHRPDSEYPNPHLCGAGVALKLVQALGGEEAIVPYLPLAALATVADVVELKSENRAIVAAGLPLVERHRGLYELLAVSGSAGQPVSSDTLAFRLAPRINAAGRMGDPARALALLMADDAAQARSLALVLNEENERRQTEEQRILRDARAMLRGRDIARSRAILLYSPDWNPGVTGIVAARLTEEHYRPALLFHEQDGVLTGSCRSIPGIDLFECLQAFEAYFIRYGGHAQAAGISMQACQFEEFSAAFDAYLRERCPAQAFVPSVSYEREYPISALSAQEIEKLQLLAPYGEGNPQPVFLSHGVTLEGVSRMGRDEAHLRAVAVQRSTRAQLVAFGQGSRAQELSQGMLDLLYTPQINAYQERKRLQLLLRAAKPVAFFDDASYMARNGMKFYDAFFRNVLYNVSRSASFPALSGIGEEEAMRTLQGGVNGTLIVCLTPHSAQRLMGLLTHRQARDFLDIHWHAVPAAAGSCNAALLAPYPNPCAGGLFENVFLYDSEEGWLRYGGETPFAAPESCYAQLLAPLRLPRESMGRIYQAFAALLEQGRATRAALVNGAGAQSCETALLALLTFVELGFFEWDAATDTVAFRPDAPPRSLMESRVYAAANGAEELMDTAGCAITLTL